MKTLHRLMFLLLKCFFLCCLLGACPIISMETDCGRGLVLPPPPPPPPLRPRTLTWTGTAPPGVHSETLQWEGLLLSITVMSSTCIATAAALIAWIRTRKRLRKRGDETRDQ